MGNEEKIFSRIYHLSRQYQLNDVQIFSLFELCKAVWMHNGDLINLQPHTELTSGECSNGYFNCREVLKYASACELLARQIYIKFKSLLYNTKIDWVIGSAYSSITFSYELAKFFMAKHGFVEKSLLDKTGKRMIWNEGIIEPNETVLQVEDLVTTGRTFFETRRAIQDISGDKINFLPYVLCIVHRPHKLPVNYQGNIKVVSLIEREVWTSKQQDCPLCKLGSKRFRPKSNWSELTVKQ